ncbi:hypothetical protein CDAR_90201 [Caerostris darwini]|uniref:Uncharacterized protein n=1 Tax=Caerostris darwini TaxID=1538125 RepID=A0AAV4NQW1_9ARAC|nr:hypothetical protein CDAR_90201 [Caerostris darwini]
MAADLLHWVPKRSRKCHPNRRNGNERRPLRRTQSVSRGQSHVCGLLLRRILPFFHPHRQRTQCRGRKTCLDSTQWPLAAFWKSFLLISSFGFRYRIPIKTERCRLNIKMLVADGFVMEGA